MRQITPARAKQKLLDPKRELRALSGSNYFAEEKKDGHRLLMHTPNTDDDVKRALQDPSLAINRFTTRVQSKVTGVMGDNTDKLPHLNRLIVPAGWVIDGEVISAWGETSHQMCANTVSVMGSNAARARQLQERHGFCTYEVFDVLFANGVDIRNLPLVARLEKLKDFLDRVHHANPGCNKHLFQIRGVHNPADFAGFYEQIMAEKGEGIIIKDQLMPYNHARAWFKWKHRFEMDVICTGDYEHGQGKFAGLIGSIFYGVYKDGEFVPVGKCSGMTDAEREAITKLAIGGKLKGRVMHISAYEVTKGGTLRNSNFERWRPDKMPEDCLWETEVLPHIRWMGD